MMCGVWRSAVQRHLASNKQVHRPTRTTNNKHGPSYTRHTALHRCQTSNHKPQMCRCTVDHKWPEFKCCPSPHPLQLSCSTVAHQRRRCARPCILSQHSQHTCGQPSMSQVGAVMPHSSCCTLRSAAWQYWPRQGHVCPNPAPTAISTDSFTTSSTTTTTTPRHTPLLEAGRCRSTHTHTETAQHAQC
jgi:hypothetical protein